MIRRSVGPVQASGNRCNKWPGLEDVRATASKVTTADSDISIIK